MWETYRTIRLIIKLPTEDYMLDLPIGNPRPTQEFITFELIADGAIILDKRILHIDLSENRIDFR